jgi:hypothetical protein
MMAKIDRARIERVARLYATSQDAGRALGIAPASFCRLCRQYGIETPYTRRMRDYRETPQRKDRLP